MKKVSIIVPVYNVEKYLRKCLDSLFNQTYKDYLVICVNDGSTDNSLSILEEYKKKYSDKMVLISKENGGLSSARNAGLDYIKDWNNSYITFVDSDDWVDKDYLFIIYEQIIKTSSDIVCVAHKIIDGNSIVVTIKNQILGKYDSLLLLFSGTELQSFACCKLFKSCLFINIRFPKNISIMEDQATTYKLFLKSKKINIFNYAGYNYYQRPESLLHSKITNAKIINVLLGYQTACMDELLKDKIRQAACQLFIDKLLRLLPMIKHPTKNEKITLNSIIVETKQQKLEKLQYTKISLLGY